MTARTETLFRLMIATYLLTPVLVYAIAYLK